ncbi:deoxyguanosinetriphosphate triphosphohydrolase [Pelomonas sp. BJYL3]|uniref:deoxyguanosinetriphosphate triphosphohydrolase n=1 Tax=Pelomonas sp. BJYL3 TaxID=2976697 RepID=UPI0022B539FD|nr:deoxyguanosinetriphosphate triphosphohydrolase [Pelomonas sp. BJYL3]
MTLKPYACHANASRGRRFPEPAAPTRSEFQRDRDRIVHSSAFRRLVYKTQVFLNHEGDLFRTRLTHSLEVAQLGRSIGRSLGLDEDLIETVALAHDLGHTPFGHAGQDVLDDCMKAHGGFEHNLQSLRVVDHLEQRYPAFDGLNLTFESREGILKHCARRNAEQIEAREPGGIAQRFLSGGQPSLEAQLCNLADEVAYNAHDIDDGVRSGLLTLEQLESVPLVQHYLRETLAAYPALKGKRLLFETIRRMLSQQVYDIIEASEAALDEHRPGDVDAVRRAPPLIRFTPAMRQASTELKRFLFANLYRHAQVRDTRQRAETVLRDLFAAYLQDRQHLPPDFAEQRDHPRACADYIAGMTDRFALKEHERLTGQRLFA